MKKSITLRLTQEQEDRLMVHAARHRIKAPTTMAQLIFEDGLDLNDLRAKGEYGDTPDHV